LDREFRAHLKALGDIAFERALTVGGGKSARTH
jgi:hypothetical protein